MQRRRNQAAAGGGPRTIRVAGTIVLAAFIMRAAVAPAEFVPSLLAAVIDAAILGGFLVAASAVPRRSAVARPAVAAVSAMILVVYGSLLFWHAWFLDVAGEYRFSLVGVTPGSLLFFSREIVPAPAWAVFAGVWGLAYWSRDWRAYDRMVPAAVLGAPRAVRLTLGSVLLALGLCAAAFGGMQHPLRATLVDAVRDSRSRPVRATGRVLPTGHLDLRRRETWPVTSRFRRVLVFVMEGVSRRDFDAQLPRLPADGFFHVIESFATKYDGYYTVNQESRTARMAMVHSLMIPYEAYLSNWLDVFGWIYEHGGLVDLLDANGWQTVMAIPMVDPPWDLRNLPWTTRITIGESDIGRPGFTCLAPTAFDRGCEDRILLARIDSLLDEAGPVFLFQPFLFGHTSRWEQTTGIGRVQYYDRYLEEVLGALRERDALDETLIVVTADHGPRFYEEVSRSESYEVPLWLVHPGFPAETRSGFFANTEFRDLLLETMSAGVPPASRRRPFLLAMGPSTRALFMCATPDGRSAFFRITGAAQATVVRAATEDAGYLESCVSTFFGYRSGFGAPGRR